MLIEWIREYVESGSQGLTCDIEEVGISVNFLTAENLSTDRLANGYLLAKSALSIGWQPAELAGLPRPRPLTSYQPTYVFGDVE